MAPEQVAALPSTMATDVYGLGGILYFLLTGHPPFERSTFIETCTAVRVDQPSPPSLLNPQIPRDLETICLKCIAKQPESRYQTVDAFLQDLNSFQQGHPISARPITRIERFAYWTRRNPALAAVSSVAMIGGLCCAIAIIWLWRQSAAETRRAQESLVVAEKTSRQLLESIDRFSQSLSMAEKTQANLHLQQELLSGICHSYRQLPAELLQDPAVLRPMAVCLYKLGLIQKQLFVEGEYLETIGQAGAIFKRLAEGEPGNPEHWFDLFHCLNVMGQAEAALEVNCLLQEVKSGLLLVHKGQSRLPVLDQLGSAAPCPLAVWVQGSSI